MLYRTSTLEITVRPYLKRDFEFIQNIDLKSYDLIWEAGKWDKHLHETHVAVVEDRTVGFWVADTKSRIIRILRLAVTPSFRRKKIGTFLLHDLIQYYSDSSTITSVIGESQEPAAYFLRHHSFDLINQINNYPTPGGFETGYIFHGSIIRENS